MTKNTKQLAKDVFRWARRESERLEKRKEKLLRKIQKIDKQTAKLRNLQDYTYNIASICPWCEGGGWHPILPPGRKARGRKRCPYCKNGIKTENPVSVS